MDAKAEIRRWACEAGAARCGFAEAQPVDEEARRLYDSWIAEGKNGTMDYCRKYADVRSDPRLLLDGARTVVCCAFPYESEERSAIISRYALGRDYHHAVKERLASLAEKITAAYGGECRAVVDTAPMRERYWAVKSGIGFTGINNQLIIPGLGSYFFLGELLWTGYVEPDTPCTLHCVNCRRCVIFCPGKALDGKGGCDARKCVSYLTIEHRGELPEGANLAGKAYGCDICQQVCPHNRAEKTPPLPEFVPDPEILGLSADDLAAMTPNHYKKITARSAMRRAPLPQLLRNIAHSKP